LAAVEGPLEEKVKSERREIHQMAGKFQGFENRSIPTYLYFYLYFLPTCTFSQGFNH